MIKSLEIIEQFIEPLNNLKINYIVTGSVASIIYGNPRLTHDIDLVISIDKKQAETFLGSFDAKRFYVPPVEIFQIELQRDSHGHVNIIHLESGFKADLYFAGHSELQLWALNNFQNADFFDLSFRLAPIEYVIIQKLLFYREARMQKHIIDIQGMLEQSIDMIDFEKLKSFISEYNLQATWQIVKG